MLNLARFVRETSAVYPDKIAFRLGESIITYAQFEAMSNQVANFLVQKGIQKNDKIALSCPNLPYFPIVYYGILKAGAVVVPLNILLKPREIAYHLSDSESKMLFLFEGTDELPLAKMGAAAFSEVPNCKELIIITKDVKSPSPVPETTTLAQILATHAPIFDMRMMQADDTAIVLYTSGTTGRPKGAELTHLNMIMNAIMCSKLADSKEISANEYVYLLVLPAFHAFGQTIGLNAMINHGSTIIMLPRFDAKAVLQTILEHKVTLFTGVPTMYWAMLKEAKNWPPEKIQEIAKILKVCVSGGAALPGELVKNFEKVFHNRIWEGYGLSETSPLSSFNHMDRKLKVGSIGQAIWGVDMKVVDPLGKPIPVGEVGEIVIRGHNIMKGYYNRPKETKQAICNGWFHTGDIGKMDDDGYFYIVDRLKDMIVRGGLNVYPREIEEVMSTHPAISLVAVVGIKHEKLGEEVKAHVVLKEDQKITSEELIAWCKKNMADYKYPRVIEIHPELPMGATGKILKRELRG